MAHLTLAGLSDDGKRLLLVSDKGVEFTLDIDARLRAALRGEHARLGHLEIRMDSALRPRDIQARIRAGETPEAVAQAAQTTVDRIMAFAAPVLAERQHVAERAQRSSVRRKPGESASGARTLGDAVAGHLRSLNVDPETVTWDARRREDGRWTLTGDYTAEKRQRSAAFIYDPPGNYVTLENEDARWLIGEQVAAARPPRDDLKRARGRRLSAVPHEELPLGATGQGPTTLGDDAIEMVNEESASLGAEQPLEAYLDDERPTRETPAVEDSPAEPAAEERPEPQSEPQSEPQPAPEPAAEERPARRQAKRKGRASVPSWDEIMFGGGKND
ncbi:septation protein SepH [Nocardioides sp.]|uniref:septation protein SepH n=1 Tax=Nocardioides sp. TaxID=35761 RepID=UPI002D7E92A9|nr:septation protein SepH [Nocardioides sp.]HET8959627.1 septation protein SepH [Nocardioides sp.]